LVATTGYETSAKIAANVSTCTEWAVVVSGTSYPDALSANYLAGALTNSASGYTPYNVPVLSVGTDAVPASIAAYMASAGVKNVYIVGGTSAVSAAVQTALQATSATKCTGASTIGSTAPVPNQKLNVVRLAGADRYATNRASGQRSAREIFPGTRNILPARVPADRVSAPLIVATGAAFADALAAGPCGRTTASR
jgi:putative cell wall-binding protein